jgi:hypothetical protein
MVLDHVDQVNRVTWVVENIDKVRPAWEALGLSGIEVSQYPIDRPVSRQGDHHLRVADHRPSGQSDRGFDPAGEGQANANTDFLAKHGDGILSIVHEVEGRPALEQEILRMKSSGVAVLQQVTVSGDQFPVTYVYFDTEPEGKFALGLVYRPGGMRAAAGPAVVSHFGAVVWDAAAVSAYWEKLGFPPISVEHVTPRADSRYRDKPLSLALEVGYQRHTQFRYEWISPPPEPGQYLCGLPE